MPQTGSTGRVPSAKQMAAKLAPCVTAFADSSLYDNFTILCTGSHSTAWSH